MRNADFHVQGPQIHQFNNISPQKIPRSSFKRDYKKALTFNPNYLIPLHIDEILPGDDFNLSLSAMIRLSTPLKPIMDNLYFETFTFFVPRRLVWDNWEKFQGQQTNPGDSIAYTVPVLDGTKAPLSTTGFTEQTVYDYMGLPTKVTSAGTTDLMNQIDACYNRAMDLIWNEWFRDENLQNSLTIATGNGPDDPATYALRKRNMRKDYFRSMLPWPQKGTALTLPMGQYAPVVGIGMGNQTYGSGLQNVYETGTIGSTVQYANSKTTASSTPSTNVFIKEDPNNAGYPLIQADLANATGPTLNAFRQIVAYSHILELDARTGTRYVESLFSRFGVVSPDFRLQRPELIGQGSSRINVYAIPQTSATGATGTTTPQGNLAAFGTGTVAQGDGGHRARYAATEHGIVIMFANVRADVTYQQGIERMFTRRTRYEFYEPLLNGLGEQAVPLGELYAQGTTSDNTVVGYQERFADYRYKNSQIVGYFRANATGTLKSWNLSQQFGAAPSLNSAFIEENMPIDQVLAVSTATAPAFMAECAFSYNHVRPMPVRSNPGLTRL